MEPPCWPVKEGGRAARVRRVTFPAAGTRCRDPRFVLPDAFRRLGVGFHPEPRVLIRHRSAVLPVGPSAACPARGTPCGGPTRAILCSVKYFVRDRVDRHTRVRAGAGTVPERFVLLAATIAAVWLMFVLSLAWVVASVFWPRTPVLSEVIPAAGGVAAIIAMMGAKGNGRRDQPRPPSRRRSRREDRTVHRPGVADGVHRSGPVAVAEGAPIGRLNEPAGRVALTRDRAYPTIQRTLISSFHRSGP